MKPFNLTGRKFGRLTAIRYSHTIRDKAGHKRRYWIFQCVCGKEKIVSVCNVGRGVKSCGCLQKETQRKSKKGIKHKTHKIIHGFTFRNGDKLKLRFYEIWRGMRQRCEKLYCVNYYRYGAKGIKVCNMWKNFIIFKNDMYLSYLNHVKIYGEKNTSIDRINPFGNYEPSNCRWATRSMQSKNQIRRIEVM